jgi:L-alanine-DL-glutamate epimerase-like enolase superfamily enzyme
MKITHIDPIIVSVPYKHRETSARVQRDGVTAVLVKITTDDGIVGWGESCPGPNVESIYEIIKSTIPIFTGRDPWNREAMAHDFFSTAHWFHREMSGNFAFAGIDMALWDICGKACRQPLYNLFGGPVRREVDYFCYLAYGAPENVAAQARRGVEMGYTVFYVKVGLNFDAELSMIAALREAIGPDRKIRIDANGAWSLNEAVRYLAEFDRYKIDFAEQPVWSDPIRNMVELRNRTPIALAANEGLWRVCDVYEAIRHRVADVLCFSSNWVGALAQFHRLSHLARLEGLRVCRHTHGELGLMAAASHHVCLTLPNLVDGNQQTAEMMEDDILTEPLPIATGSKWGIPKGVGLCVEVDEKKVRKYHRFYEKRGQFLPYQPSMFRHGG